ncbi:hypothetical protein [Rodentibacter pneumotropicus]|uniref:Uncharacterized protein n=1 Tax=Rodentibacter pneumotropicus TaxID=758 RepID=A0A4S2Q2M1_9PAST|nr:hypothetical protein [Rodentibacter pneumotropicus]THA10751.1 hypothetical protein D3M78_02170 [Rodentibacter pneumotropicus]
MINKSSDEQESKILVDELNELIEFLSITQLQAVEIIERHYSTIYDNYTKKDHLLSFESFKKILQGRKISAHKLRLYIGCLKKSKEYHRRVGLYAAENGDDKILGKERQKELHQLSKHIRNLINEKEKSS